MVTPERPRKPSETETVIGEEVVDLTPSEEIAFDAELDDEADYEFDQTRDDTPHVEVVAGGSPSLATKTTSLLHSRLQAVTLLVIIVNIIFLVGSFVGSFMGEQIELFGSFALYRAVVVVRIAFVGAILAILCARRSYSNTFLRGVEYALFAALTLFWIYARYSTVVFNASGDSSGDQFRDDRESLIQLWLIMLFHGLFIPHTWQGSARVILTMALAPAFVLVLLQELHPELRDQLAPLMSRENLTHVILIVLVGSILAIYGAGVLNAMRVEVHNARKFGQYETQHLLGKGGMGEVYLAEHALLKRPCAMKLIHSESTNDPTALARFEREVQTTASLTHPHVIEIYDYGYTDDGTFYYVMEFLPGMSLEQLIAQIGSLPPGRVIYLLRQACSALAEAHEAWLIHRDLKPANLYVSERGGLCDFIKVLDFGLVKLTNAPEAAQLTADHVVSGTPLYMAPEQAAAERGLDGRCDIYALGAIAYHMLTGKPPFEGESPVAVMIAHASKEVVPPSQLCPDIPKDLEQVVLRCLQKKPDDRFADVIGLDDALADCAAADDWDSKKAAIWWQEALTVPAEVFPTETFGTPSQS